jgi:Spy/CpxP family protein refolding chaperone
MKTVKVIFWVCIFFIFTALNNANANPQRQHKRPPKPYLELELFSEELGLTEEQQSAIKEQQFQTEKEVIELRSKIEVAELELKNLLREDNPDEAEIKNKIEEIGQLKSELRWVKVQAKLGLRDLLTSEQYEKLKTLKKEQMKKRLHGRRNF